MRRSTLILSLLLAVSVAVNMLLAGLILGHRWSGGPRGGGDHAMLFDRAFAAVPPPQRDEIRRRLEGEADLRGRMREVGAARRALGEALRARPFDPAAADAALAELRRRTAEAQAVLHDTVTATMAEAQAAGTLPPPPTRTERTVPEPR